MSRVAVGICALCHMLHLATCDQSQSRLVELIQGPVKGYKDTKYDIYAFYDIPYAKAPTGSNKFKGPLPPPVWSEVFEGVDKRTVCPQGNFFGFVPDDKTMQEDCLTTTVYVPDTKEKKLPVVVYVHGGGYFMGWGNLMTPKNLVNSKKIIAVTFNYRVGAHGFLCLGTKDVPGNAGMKDQVALLRWVKANIVKFDGNPEDVTIAGYSAGSSSVDLLMISKMANNLFKRVIPESGANTASFSVQTDPIKYASEYATLMSSMKFNSLKALEDFYKSASYELLYSVDVFNKKDSTFYMTPCIERDLGEEMFLDDSPFNILKSGNYNKVPMLYGFANMEGLIRITVFDQWKDSMNDRFSDFLPGDLKFKSEDEREPVANKVKRFYFGDKEITANEDSVLAYVDYFTDVMFAYATLRAIKLHLKAGNNQIYLYEYSFYDDDTPVVPYTNGVRGANHCAQTNVVMDEFVYRAPANSSDDRKKHTQIVRDIWLNFITTGKPVPEVSELPAWPPVEDQWAPHMSLGRTIQLKRSLLKERTLFWDDIYAKYYFNPIPPTTSEWFEHTEL